MNLWFHMALPFDILRTCLCRVIALFQAVICRGCRHSLRALRVFSFSIFVFFSFFLSLAHSLARSLA